MFRLRLAFTSAVLFSCVTVAAAQDAKPAVAAKDNGAPAAAKPQLPRVTGPKGNIIFQLGTFTPDGKTFLYGGLDKSIHACSASDGKPLFTLPGHFIVVSDRRIGLQTRLLGMAGNNLLVSAGEYGPLFLWDLEKRLKVGEVPRNKQTLRCLEVARSGKLLATGGGEETKGPGELRLWDLQTRDEIAALPGHSQKVMALAFSSDDRLLAAADYSGAVRIWDVAARKTIATLSVGGPATAVRFSPDGKYLVTGDQRGRIVLWDTAAWVEYEQVQAHLNPVRSLQIAPRGHLLISAAADPRLKLWSMSQLEDEPAIEVGNPHETTSFVGASPDGKTVASLDAKSLLSFWTITPELDKRFAPPPAPSPPRVVTRDQPARLALLASPAVDAGRIVQDLALINLVDEKGMVLLERAQVEKLLQEQKLSLSGLVDPAAAVKAGKLLAVDLLGVIESSPASKQTLGFVVFDAVTGARLADVGFEPKAADLQARETASAVRAAVTKWRAGTKNLKTVCFLPPRNADLPRHMDAATEGLSAILERQVLHHPLVATLERRWLEGVSQEKTLVAEAAGRELLASVLLVQLEVGQGGKGAGLRATLTITDNAGKLVKKVEHETADAAADLVGPLVQRLHEALATAQGSAVLWRGREVRRFVREAQTLREHKQARPALRAAEAAHALRPSETSRTLLAEHLFYVAQETWKPGGFQQHIPFVVSLETFREGLNLARRAAQLLDATLPADRPENSFFGQGEYATCLNAEADTLVRLRYLKVRPADASADEEIRDFRGLCLRQHVARLRELAIRVGPTSHGLDRLTTALENRFMVRSEQYAPDSAALMQAHQDALALWADLSRQVPADKFPVHAAGTFANSLRKLYDTRFAELQFTRADRERSLPQLEALTNHPHPLVRLYAAHYHNLQQLKAERIKPGEAQQQFRTLIEEVKRWIDQPPFAPSEPQREALYVLWSHLVFWSPGPPPPQAHYFAMADFMLERKDVVDHAWIRAAESGMSKDQRARNLHMVRRMMTVLAAPPHRLFIDREKRIKKALEKVEGDILILSPELDKERAIVPWDKVLTLVDASRLKQVNALLAPVRHGDHVYCFAGGYEPDKNNQPYLQLLRAGLDGKSLQTLGKVHVNPKGYDGKDPHLVFRSVPFFITQCVIHEGRIYARTFSDGIYSFPLAGGDVRHIAAKEGLPSLGVVALAALEGKLVAALEDGYIVVYDPAANQCEVIASSRRTQPLSPFDNQKPFRVRALIADPERQRVLISLSGLWEYHLKTGKFKKLLPDSLFHPTTVKDGSFYMKGQDWFGKFDLAKDRFTLLDGVCPEGIDPQKPAGLPRELAVVFPHDFQNPDLPRALYHEGYIWNAHYFHRKPIDGGRQEYLPHVTRPELLYVHWHILEAVSANQLLVGDYRGIHLVHLKKVP